MQFYILPPKFFFSYLHNGPSKENFLVPPLHMVVIREFSLVSAAVICDGSILTGQLCQ